MLLHKLLVLVSLVFLMGARGNGQAVWVSGSGKYVQSHRDVSWQVPVSAESAYSDFLRRYAGQWQGVWNEETNVPHRLFGSGIQVPGANESEAKAVEFATAFVGQNREMLLPGGNKNDLRFDHVTNTLGVRSVVFQQYVGALPVEGARVRLSFKNNRLILLGATTLPGKKVARTRTEVDPMSALRWIENEYGIKGTIESVEPKVIVSVHDGSTTSLFEAVPVVVSHPAGGQTNLPGKWRVYMQGKTPIVRRQMLHFGNSTVYYNTPERWPGSTRLDYPSNGFRLSDQDNGAQYVPDMLGDVMWPEVGNRSVTTLGSGGGMSVIDLSNTPREVVSLLDGSDTVIASNNELLDGVYTVLVHGNLVREYLRGIDPTETWLNSSMEAYANDNNECNAYFDGSSIVMFRGLGTCTATSRMPDVIYHETGHFIHSVRYGFGFDSALSEGISDYLAATIVNDSAMGRGFFTNNGPLRELNPVGSEATWPHDIDDNVPHTTGLIMGGTLWDLRARLIATHGEEVGVPIADKIFYGIITNADDIPASYAEALAIDDDDGNLANGTPNKCDIDVVFAGHGLAPQQTAELRHTRNDLQISTDRAVFSSPQCGDNAVEAVKLVWKTNEDDGEVDMLLSGDTFSGSIPTDANWVKYHLLYTWSSGVVERYPRNDADPDYALYRYDFDEIECFDFETDPATEGWELSGGFEWGAPQNSDTGPSEASSGQNIIGTVVAGNYRPNRQYKAVSPAVSVGNADRVFLIYDRWLASEKGEFDEVELRVNGTTWWNNRADIDHIDYEWREVGVEVTNVIEDGKVSVEFALDSDGGKELYGWGIDRVCFYGVGEATCGDGRISGAETCDEGEQNNDTDVDGCRTTCQVAFCGDGVVDTGETCDPLNDSSCSEECVLKEDSGCCSTGAPTLFPVSILALFLFLVRRTFM